MAGPRHAAAAGHGTSVPRGQQAAPARGTVRGRFGRMFGPRRAPKETDDAIDLLVALMATRAPAGQQRQNPRIPAGFTYLGQFIDHDITFDPTSRRDRREDPRALVNFRTPRYDLDSVYGAGPSAQPYLYDWDSEPKGTRLLVAHPAGGPDDLPRNEQDRAIIGDHRNDENVMVSQLHLLFIKFHNAVMQHLIDTGSDEEDLFEEAQRIVRWHYQWVVLKQFLPAVTGVPAPVTRTHFRWKNEPFMPVEFSGAAYRFGHSMVRNDYVLKLPKGGKTARATKLFPGLRGRQPLTRKLELDWERFFRFEESEIDPQPSFRIDTNLAKPLFNMPDDGDPLARLNLERGRALVLPSGQQAARAMHKPALSEDALLPDDKATTELGDALKLGPSALAKARAAVIRATPLWYYILSEAAHTSEGKHLGPVGGGIVGEVLTGLLEGDPSSFVHRRPRWKPTELGTDGDFTMTDLIRFVRRAEGA